MKIAMVLPGGVDRGGEERVIPAFLALIERLSREHDVHVFALHQEPQPGNFNGPFGDVDDVALDDQHRLVVDQFRRNPDILERESAQIDAEADGIEERRRLRRRPWPRKTGSSRAALRARSARRSRGAPSRPPTLTRSLHGRVLRCPTTSILR